MTEYENPVGLAPCECCERLTEHYTRRMGDRLWIAQCEECLFDGFVFHAGDMPGYT